MKARYILTPESLKTGVSYHYAHHSKFLGAICVFIGMFLLAVAALQLSAGNGGALTLVFILLGFLNLFAKQFWISRSVKQVFKNGETEQRIKFRANPVGLHLESGDSRGTTKWTHFADCLIKKDGILLYPKKSLYYWIPRSAEFSEGNWEEFVAMVEKKVNVK